MIKNIVITGATGGIGSAICNRLAKHKNYNLHLIGKNEKKLLKLRNNLKTKYKGKYSIYQSDFNNLDSVRKCFLDILKNEKKIFGLINNAGILEDSLLGMITDKNLNSTFNVNLFSSIKLTQYLIKLMSKNGSIVNISSIIGRYGNKGQAVYSSSKAAVIGFTLSIAKELGERNIRVNAIAPGIINTKMINNIPKEKLNDLKKNIAMKKIGKPKDVANLVNFLLSDEASYISGQVIGVDGCMSV